MEGWLDFFDCEGDSVDVGGGVDVESGALAVDEVEATAEVHHADAAVGLTACLASVGRRMVAVGGRAADYAVAGAYADCEWYLGGVETVFEHVFDKCDEEQGAMRRLSSSPGSRVTSSLTAGFRRRRIRLM